MTEEQILKAIADACQDDTLRFQIIIQDGVLYIYINRPAKTKLDYQKLESKIKAAVGNINSNYREIALYSRVLGEIEPDWQSISEPESSLLDSGQISQMIEAITEAVAATNSIVERIGRELDVPESFAEPIHDFEELPSTADDGSSAANLDASAVEAIDEAVWQLDLSKYCFIRNQRLLYAVLPPPKENIAQLVDIFHQLEQPIERSQLPILEQYFERSIMPDLDSFDSELQSWWTAIIMLDSEQKRQFAIWLSRYCMHPEQTSTTVQEVLYPQAESASASVEAAPALESAQPAPKSEAAKQHKFGLLPRLKTVLEKFWGAADDEK